MDGFTTMALNVQPEARLAASMALTDQYRFLISTPDLGVAYEKKWSSQVETSIRLLFPRFGNTVWSACLGILLLLILWLPLPVLLSSVVYGWTIVQALALWKLCLFMALYALYISHVWRKYWWTAIVLWPVVLSQEIGLLVLSLIGYLTGSTTWKGRPVTLSKSAAIKSTQTSNV
jgi:hypothetical protein